jgi:hypothetical protein
MGGVATTGAVVCAGVGVGVWVSGWLEPVVAAATTVLSWDAAAELEESCEKAAAGVIRAARTKTAGRDDTRSMDFLTAPVHRQNSFEVRREVVKKL